MSASPWRASPAPWRWRERAGSWRRSPSTGSSSMRPRRWAQRRRPTASWAAPAPRATWAAWPSASWPAACSTWWRNPSSPPRPAPIETDRNWFVRSPPGGHASDRRRGPREGEDAPRSPPGDRRLRRPVPVRLPPGESLHPPPRGGSPPRRLAGPGPERGRPPGGPGRPRHRVLAGPLRVLCAGAHPGALGPTPPLQEEDRGAGLEGGRRDALPPRHLYLRGGGQRSRLAPGQPARRLLRPVLLRLPHLPPGALRGLPHGLLRPPGCAPRRHRCHGLPGHRPRRPPGAGDEPLARGGILSGTRPARDPGPPPARLPAADAGALRPALHREPARRAGAGRPAAARDSYRRGGVSSGGGRGG